MGDFNNDGIHDLILGGASRFSTGVAVLVGNGDATLQPPVGVSVGVTGASFAIDPLSGDGRPDIAVGGCTITPSDLAVSTRSRCWSTILGSSDVRLTSVEVLVSSLISSRASIRT